MSTDRKTAVVEVLLVEDNPDDADLMEKALKRGNLEIRVAVVEDGEEAMNYLERKGQFATAAVPDLILLDLHMPRKTGFEVLADIKQDALLRRIPIVIMTSSTDDKTIGAAYELHANCCVAKPTVPEEFAAVVMSIETFWRRVARRTS